MDIYLRTDDMMGDVEASGYEGCTQIESLDFSVDGGSYSDFKKQKNVAALSCVTLTKRAGQSSPAIFKTVCSGALIPKATISFVHLGKKDKSEEYMQYLLEDVSFSGYSVSNKPGDNEYPLETLKLIFRRITFKYIVFDKNGLKRTLKRSGFDIDKGAII